MGLSIDMVGALLLSVEAVTLEKVRRLRDMLVQAVQHPGIVLTILGITVTFVFHFSLPLALVGVLEPDATREIDRYMNHHLFFWFPESGWLKMAAVVSWVVFAPLWVLTSWMLAAGVLAPIVGTLEWIDRKTPDGTTGVIGAVLIIFGFALQMIGV